MENQTFIDEGVIFTVEQEEDQKFVADIALGYQPGQTVADVPEWARVVGRFTNVGEAITAAKYEIAKMSGR